MRQATILMAPMGLDIGGVETHVMVLCRHLLEMGYKVVVVSAGGVYEQELATMGIKHYKVNLWTKKPIAVIRNVISMRAIIRKENVDLMHAHSRIPAFICDIAGRLTGVPYLTTAHTDFANNLLLQFISCWGQKTISVSEDIKEHMEHECKVPASRQVVILNGIDATRFRPGLDYRLVQNELGLSEDNFKILYVSRLDKQLANVACQVLEAFAAAAEVFPQANLIVVGAGNREEEVRKLADAINSRLGREGVLMLGRRTDIPQLLNMADLFIGLSRAALEAMACELPVILAGVWSYVGPLTNKNSAVLIKDNFTGRTLLRPLVIDDLVQDIKSELARDVEQRIAIGHYNRNLVLKYYSSREMAEKTAQIYEEILKRSVKSWASSMKKGDYSGKPMSLIYWLLCWSWLQSAEASINTFL